jgi:hypothetical protein
MNTHVPDDYPGEITGSDGIVDDSITSEFPGRVTIAFSGGSERYTAYAEDASEIPILAGTRVKVVRYHAPRTVFVRKAVPCSSTDLLPSS